MSIPPILSGYDDANKSSAFTIPIFIRVFFVGNRFRPGPWNLGKFSIPIGVVASLFVILMVPILCFPSVTGPDLTYVSFHKPIQPHQANPVYSAADMNWTAVVYGGPMVLVTIWWFVSAHKWFKGPKVNIEHMMIGREEAVVEGQASRQDGDSSSGEGHVPEKILKS